jgi:hypothetical protein
LVISLVPKAAQLLVLVSKLSFLREELRRLASDLLSEKPFDMLKMLGSMRSAAQDLVFP